MFFTKFNLYGILINHIDIDAFNIAIAQIKEQIQADYPNLISKLKP